VLLKRGKPIDEFATPVELLEAMRDTLKGHRSLLVVGSCCTAMSASTTC
jgi:hypothetical protein